MSQLSGPFNAHSSILTTSDDEPHDKTYSLTKTSVKRTHLRFEAPALQLRRYPNFSQQRPCCIHTETVGSSSDRDSRHWIPSRF